jgi:hypothetical protein
MDRTVEQYHPDRIVDSSLGRRLPSRWRQAVQLGVVALAWYGLVSSFISIVASLSWVIDGAQWLIDNAGIVKPILLQVADAIHTVVEAWRNLTAPIYRLLFGWLPFRVPREALDLLIVVSIFTGGYLRAWLATADERQLMSVFNNDLSLEGKIAVVKRIRAALEIISGRYPEHHKDKAEIELVSALDEMTDGISDKDYEIIEASFDMKPDELSDFLIRCAIAEREASAIRHSIVRRSTVVAAVLCFFLLVDLVYRLAI